jgi:hypothetical protein
LNKNTFSAADFIAAEVEAAETNNLTTSGGIERPSSTAARHL